MKDEKKGCTYCQSNNLKSERRPEGRKECLQCVAAKPYGETFWVTEEMENDPCFMTKEQIRLFCEESQEERLLRYMKSEEKIEKIARLCHEVNRIYCKAIGDFSHKSWEETPEELQNSVKAGVVNNLLKDLTPRQSHEEWLEYRSCRGWVYGKEKDLEKKTHPCMVDYDDLPPEQRVKDEFFNFICNTFKGDGSIWKSDFDFAYIPANQSSGKKPSLALREGFVLNKSTAPLMVREGFSSALANGQKEKAICKNCIYSERQDSLVEWLCNYYPNSSQTQENNFCSKGLFEIVYDSSEKGVTTSDSGVRGAVEFANKVKTEKEAPPSDFGFNSYDNAKDLKKE